MAHYNTILNQLTAIFPRLLVASNMSGVVAHNVSGFYKSQGGGFYETDRSATGVPKNEI